MKALCRGALATLVALLLVVESAGAARAFGEGSTVDCCCGAHSIARACRCAHCPTLLRQHPHRETGMIGAPSACLPHAHDGLLLVQATVSPPSALTHSPRFDRIAPTAPHAPSSVHLDPARPPP